jgi:hypothetical protein
MKTAALPFTVKAYTGWPDHDPLLLRYATLADAVDGARALSRTDYPLVDLSFGDCGMVASRRLVAHPMDPDFTPTDTLGGAA